MSFTDTHTFKRDLGQFNNYVQLSQRRALLIGFLQTLRPLGWMPVHAAMPHRNAFEIGDPILWQTRFIDRLHQPTRKRQTATAPKPSSCHCLHCGCWVGLIGEYKPTFQFQAMFPATLRRQTTSSLNSYIPGRRWSDGCGVFLNAM
jgi:hypothetical protein